MTFSTSEIILALGFIGSSLYCMILHSKKDLIVEAYRATYDNNKNLIFICQHNSESTIRICNLLEDTMQALSDCRVELVKEQAKHNPTQM
jgi:hypothetical protein